MTIRRGSFCAGHIKSDSEIINPDSRSLNTLGESYVSDASIIMCPAKTGLKVLGLAPEMRRSAGLSTMSKSYGRLNTLLAGYLYSSTLNVCSSAPMSFK